MSLSISAGSRCSRVRRSALGGLVGRTDLFWLPGLTSLSCAFIGVCPLPANQLTLEDTIFGQSAPPTFGRSSAEVRLLPAGTGRQQRDFSPQGGPGGWGA